MTKSAEELMRHFLVMLPEIKSADFVMGKTKIFLKVAAVSILEAARAHTYQTALLQVQRVLRGSRTRQHLSVALPLLSEIRTWLAAHCRGNERPWRSGNLSFVIRERFSSPEDAAAEAAKLRCLLNQAQLMHRAFGILNRAEVIAEQLDREARRLIAEAEAERQRRIAEEEARRKREAEEAKRRQEEEEAKRREQQLAKEAAAAAAAAAAAEAQSAPEAAEAARATARKLADEARARQAAAVQAGALDAIGSAPSTAPEAVRAAEEPGEAAALAEDVGSWSVEELRRAVLRLREEKEGLRRALQSALLESVRREETTQAECVKLRTAFKAGPQAAGPEDNQAVRADAASLIEENTRLKAALSTEQAKSTAWRAEALGLRTLYGRAKAAGTTATRGQGTLPSASTASTVGLCTGTSSGSRSRGLNPHGTCSHASTTASSGATPSPAESVGSTSGASGSDISESLGGPGAVRAAASVAAAAAPAAATAPIASAASRDPRRPAAVSGAVSGYPGIEVPRQTDRVSCLHGLVAEGHNSSVVSPACSNPAASHGRAHVAAEEGKYRRPLGEMLE